MRISRRVLPDLFQSTLPTRGSDDYSAGWGYAPSYFNPRSPRGGATHISTQKGGRKDISIHAPHEGERLLDPDWPGWDDVFQSTLPTRGSDNIKDCIVPDVEKFQSTLPTRGSDKN